MPFFTIGAITSAGENEYEEICGTQTADDGAGRLGTEVPHAPAAAGCGRALVKLLHSLGYETVRQFCLVVVGGAFEEGSEFARARRVAQLAQGFGFNLADAFASDGE